MIEKYISTAAIFFVVGWVWGYVDSYSRTRKTRRVIAMMKDKTDKAVLEAFYGLEKEE